MSIYSWNAVEWLEKEYDTDSPVIGFFVNGGYLSKDKTMAEQEFIRAVKSLMQREGTVKAWAEAIMSTDFRCLQTTETLSYWSSLAITSIAKEDVIKFKVTTQADFRKRSASKANVPDQPRKHITVSVDDGVHLTGLDVSLLSHLRTLTTNKLHTFEAQSEKEKYYTTATMNNVLDLTNQKNSDQLRNISPVQIEELRNKFPCQDPPLYYTDPVKDIMIEKGKNIKHALKYINGGILDAAEDDMCVLKMYREVLENHCMTPQVFDERKDYSEMDYIIYFWAPLLKGLFAKADVWPHWGDTESEDCKYKFRMDLRFLCNSVNNSPDHGAGEFARNLTPSKYYSDKTKLVLNGIIQLDNILSTYKGDSKDVKLPLFQALAYSADLYYLYRVNPCLYVLDRVGAIDYPVSKKDVIAKTADVVERLLTLKNMVKILEENISDSIQNSKKTVESVIVHPVQVTSQKRSVWQSP